MIVREPDAVLQPAGAFAQFENARAPPYRVASMVREHPVSLGQIPHIGQSTGLDILYRRKVRDDRTVVNRGLQQLRTVIRRGLVVELDDILLILTDAVDQLAAWPGALLTGE